MELEGKRNFTGVLKRKKVDIGMKVEAEVMLLQLDNGSDLQIRMKGDDVYGAESLKSFEGKRVSVAGLTGEGVPFLFVNSASDVVARSPVATVSAPKM